jgi:hypothetical protein
MARVIGLDKIGTLSHSGGIITMNPSLLTIGGQQYRTLSSITRTIATDITMAANTRYQIFAVVSGGVVQLRISANENSVGPAGFASWKLVGSFYANGVTGSIAFGSFVNIEGAPASGRNLFLPVVGGMSAIATYATYWERKQNMMLVSGTFTANTPVASQLTITIPSPSAIDSGTTGVAETDVVGQISTSQGSLANSYPTTAGGPWAVFKRPSNTTVSVARGSNAGQWSNANANDIFGNGYLISIDFKVPISGWSNTPIKDL